MPDRPNTGGGACDSAYHELSYHGFGQERILPPNITWAVADPAMGGEGGRPPIDQNLGLVMAARLRHGGKFSLKSLTFGHFFV